MDANAQYELYLIKKELQDIINELNSIGDGVRWGFSGIGNDRCASSIYSIRNHYQDVKRQLEKMDLNALSDEFLAKQQAEEARKASANRAAKQNQAQTSKPQTSQKPSAQNNNTQSTSKPKQEKNTSSTKTTVTKIVKEALSWLFK